MSEVNGQPSTAAGSEDSQAALARTRELVEKSLRRRYRSERRFRWYGLAAVALGMFFVAFLFFSIISKGYTSFKTSYVQLQITYDAAALDPEGTRDPQTLAQANYATLVRAALRELFADVEGRRNQRELYALVSGDAAFELRRRVEADPRRIGTSERLWLLASDELDLYRKGRIDASEPEVSRPLSDQQLGWIDTLQQRELVEFRFNSKFFTAGDSR
ncbi:MAG: DUF3333 domain-containing protein, partial [Gammaproteobacteria bacterium]|nr:DUF3333 domain-containing protein [Gammaproteobacteria bacterium]